MWKKSIISAMCVAVLTTGCTTSSQTKPNPGSAAAAQPLTLLPDSENRLDIYQAVPLTADLSSLSVNQKKMLSLLIDASKIMDDLFWQQAYGSDKAQFLARIADKDVQKFAAINYGPWDRLNGCLLYTSDAADE